jgi:hypothetical protein
MFKAPAARVKVQCAYGAVQVSLRDVQGFNAPAARFYIVRKMM